VTAPPKIRVVCATREPAGAFATATALGKSLALYKPYAFAELKLFSGNSHGLPQLYNSVIRDSRSDPAVLVFAHDDVHLCDFYWPDQLLGGLAAFDIVGLAGNRRRVPRQPSWAFVDERGTWDERANLTRRVLPTGAAFSFTYDDADRVVEVEASTGASFPPLSKTRSET